MLMWDWIKDNWYKIAFWLLLTVLSFGLWCLAKFIYGLRK